MKHITEEQFIDLLLEEKSHPEAIRHLAACEACADRMQVLRDGLRAFRRAEPTNPPTAKPKITYQKFRRIKLFSRVGLGVAASFLLLSLLGFRMEMTPGGFSVQFGIMGAFSQPLPNEQPNLAQMEARLIEAIEVKSMLTQTQLDARLNAFYAERSQELRELSSQYQDALQDIDMGNAQYLASFKQEVQEDLNKLKAQGRLQ